MTWYAVYGGRAIACATQEDAVTLARLAAKEGSHHCAAVSSPCCEDRAIALEREARRGRRYLHQPVTAVADVARGVLVASGAAIGGGLGGVL